MRSLALLVLSFLLFATPALAEGTGGHENSRGRGHTDHQGRGLGHGSNGGEGGGGMSSSTAVTQNSEAWQGSAGAASLYGGICSYGASGQGFGGGAAVIQTDPFCTLLRAAEAADVKAASALARGDEALAAVYFAQGDRMFDKAILWADSRTSKWRMKINWLFGWIPGLHLIF